MRNNTEVVNDCQSLFAKKVQSYYSGSNLRIIAQEVVEAAPTEGFGAE